MYLEVDFLSPSLSLYATKNNFKKTILNKYPTTTIDGIKVFDKLYFYGKDDSYYNTYEDVLKIFGVYDFHNQKQDKHLKSAWLFNSLYTDSIENFKLDSDYDYHEQINGDKLHTTYSIFYTKYTEYDYLQEANVTKTKTQYIYGMTPNDFMYKTSLFLSIIDYKTNSVNNNFKKLNTIKNQVSNRENVNVFTKITTYTHIYELKEYSNDYFSIDNQLDGSYIFKLTSEGVNLINDYFNELKNNIGDVLFINKYIELFLTNVSVSLYKEDNVSDVFLIKEDTTGLTKEINVYIKYNEAEELDIVTFYELFQKTIKYDYSKKKASFFESFITFVIICFALFSSSGTATFLGTTILSAFVINLSLALTIIYVINRIGVWVKDNNMRYFLGNSINILVEIDQVFSKFAMFESLVGSITTTSATNATANKSILVSFNSVLKYVNVFSDYYFKRTNEAKQNKIEEYSKELYDLEQKLTTIDKQYEIIEKIDINYDQELSEKLQANMYNYTQGLIDSYTRMY